MTKKRSKLQIKSNHLAEPALIIFFFRHDLLDTNDTYYNVLRRY